MLRGQAFVTVHHTLQAVTHIIVKPHVCLQRCTSQHLTLCVTAPNTVRTPHRCHSLTRLGGNPKALLAIDLWEQVIFWSSEPSEHQSPDITYRENIESYRFDNLVVRCVECAEAEYKQEGC